MDTQTNSTNSNKNTFLIIAIIVGVFAIGAVSFASWKYFGGGSELEKNINETIQPSIEKEIEKSDVVSETTNWKIYNNTKANFTFQYPKDWKIISEYFYETASGIKSKKLTVTLGKNEKEEISINLRQAQCNAPCKCKEINENIIQTCSQNPEVLKIFNQIISTFEIIKNDEMADWQTYENKEYGYEIKYPKSWKLKEGIWDCAKKHKSKYNCIGFNPSDKKFEYEYSYYGGDIEIFVYQNPNNLDLESFYSQPYMSKIGEIHFVNPFKHAKKIESVNVGEFTGTKFKDYEAAETLTMVSFPYQKIIIEIKDAYNLHQQDTVFNQILSTFKFTE